MVKIIGGVFIIIVFSMLYRRYVPVRGVQCISDVNGAKLQEVLVVDIRDYNEESQDRINNAINLPYAYLQRYYSNIPKEKPIHLIAGRKLDRNMGIRFLVGKGYKVNSYSLMECKCQEKLKGITI